jgi:thioester reductase-like protein
MKRIESVEWEMVACMLKLTLFSILGLPSIIIRPGSIGGSCSVGKFSPNDFFTKYGESILFLKAAPSLSNFHASFVPVDFVASFIVATSISNYSILHSSNDRGDIPVFHLIGRPSDAVTLSDVHSAARLTCEDLEEQEYSEWIHRVRNGKTNPLTPLVSYFDHGFPSLSESDTSDRNTVDFCSKWNQMDETPSESLSLIRKPITFETFCLFFKNLESF